MEELYGPPSRAEMTDVAAAFEGLTRNQLLNLMEHVPQRFWPPRPTRQDKSTLQWVVVRAVRAGAYAFDPAHAVDPLGTRS